MNLSAPALSVPCLPAPLAASAVRRASDRRSRRSGSALGINAKTVDHTAKHDRALSRVASKWAGANLLKASGSKLATVAKRLSHCGLVAFEPVVELRRNEATGEASFSGLKTCGSVWLCPCCSPRISVARKGELDMLLSGARTAGLSPVMLTLTARHDRSMRLAPFLSALKAAKQRFRQRREWKALPFQGSVTATEVTHGGNGWHPHFHEIVLLDAAPADAVRLLGDLAAVWLRCLEAFGLSGEKAAFHVQGASAVGTYVAKFGAAGEVALHGSKTGRGGSRSPWQLLDDARDGDKRAAAIWCEYAAAFHGRRQLVWSRGLKARFGIGEVPDDEAAAEVDPSPAPQVVTLRAWFGSGDGWRQARRRRVALASAAEACGCLDAAEFGLTDAQRWARNGNASVIDPSGQ